MLQTGVIPLIALESTSFNRNDLFNFSREKRCSSKLPWFKGFWIGGIGFGFGSLLLLIAQAMTDATTALAAAAMPIFAVGLEVALDGRRLSARFY